VVHVEEDDPHELEDGEEDDEEDVGENDDCCTPRKLEASFDEVDDENA
jgi:hypothetical protein